MKDYYMTKQIFNELPHPLIILIQELSLKRMNQKLDYLQIFEINPNDDGICITHRSEVPYYEKKIKLDQKYDSFDQKVKIYVIETETEATMLFSNEY